MLALLIELLTVIAMTKTAAMIPRMVSIARTETSAIPFL
jgi:hypothetical protein